MTNVVSVLLYFLYPNILKFPLLEQNVNWQETMIFSLKIATTTLLTANENSVHLYMVELLVIMQNTEKAHLRFMKKCGNDIYIRRYPEDQSWKAIIDNTICVG